MITVVSTPEEFELCLEIRFKVFVEEQGVPREIEVDELDADAVHILMRSDARVPIGTGRIVARGDIAKIGRVAVLREHRGQGVGLELMKFLVDESRRRGFAGAALSAQVRSVPFYERVGFVAEGDIYDEAGIPHRMMRREI